MSVRSLFYTFFYVVFFSVTLFFVASLRFSSLMGTKPAVVYVMGTWMILLVGVALIERDKWFFAVLLICFLLFSNAFFYSKVLVVVNWTSLSILIAVFVACYREEGEMDFGILINAGMLWVVHSIQLIHSIVVKTLWYPLATVSALLEFVQNYLLIVFPIAYFCFYLVYYVKHRRYYATFFLSLGCILGSLWFIHRHFPSQESFYRDRASVDILLLVGLLSALFFVSVSRKKTVYCLCYLLSLTNPIYGSQIICLAACFAFTLFYKTRRKDDTIEDSPL